MVVDLVRAREADDGAVLLLPGADLGRIEARRVVDAAGRVADRNDLRALRGEQRRGDAAGVAVALDRDRAALERDVRRLRPLQQGEDRAAGGGLVAAERAADAIGLPVTTPAIV